MNPPPLKTGDLVTITVEGRTVEGSVKLASPNSVSLFLEFEAILLGYVGKMPVLWKQNGYVDLVQGEQVVVEPVSG